MAIQEIQENDLIKDSREVINGNFTELDEGKLSLSGGTMTGPLFMTGANDRIVGFEVKDDGTNFDCGWNFANRDGAGFALRSTDFNNDGGSFHFWARNATNSPELVGKPNGTLTWNGSNVITAAGGTMTGNLKFSSGYISKSTDTAALSLNGGSDNESGAYLNLYGKSHASSAGAFSLSAYDGTTRKQLVGLVNGTLTWNGTSISLSGHTHSYLPLSGGTMTGEIIRNTYVVKNSVDNSYTEYLGGKDENSAYLVLYGKSHSTSPGRINLRANNGTNNSYLTLDPNGSMTWGGVSITDGTFLTTRNVTINVTTTGTGIKVGTATAPAVSKYQFVCWTYCVSSGGVFPAYPSTPQNSTSDIWAINPNSNSKVICHALYVRKW